MITVTAHLGLVALWCSGCGRVVRRWPLGIRVSPDRLRAAERGHQAALHPQQLNLDGLHDGHYEEGGS